MQGPAGGSRQDWLSATLFGDKQHRTGATLFNFWKSSDWGNLQVKVLRCSSCLTLVFPAGGSKSCSDFTFVSKGEKNDVTPVQRDS